MKYRNWFVNYMVSEDGGELTATGGAPAAASPETGAQPATTPVAPSIPAPTATPTEPSKGAWPDDWQSRVSRGDEKLQKEAARYASPEAVFDALVAAKNRIRSGELKSELPENAKPEELAAWRKDNGIPEKPDGYDLKFDSGLVVGEDDKKLIDGFLQSAHDKNMTPDQVKSTIEWYYDLQEQIANDRHAIDEDQRVEALDVLNQEWGGNFRRNINMVEGLLSKLPENVREPLKSARLPDGSAMFNNPDVLRGFASLALELNPAGTLVPNSGGDPMKGVEEEISSIEKTMRENRQAYNRDEKMQSRYRELLGAREKIKAMA